MEPRVRAGPRPSPIGLIWCAITSPAITRFQYIDYMRVLFVLHRVHPNMREAHRILSAAGHKCIFVVDRRGPSEPDFGDDTVVVDSTTFTKARAEALIHEIQPQLLIQRNFGNGLRYFWTICKNMNIPHYRYTQDPLRLPLSDFFVRPLRVFRLIRDTYVFRASLGKHYSVTPVSFWGDTGGPSFAGRTYLPFPMEIRHSKKLSITPPFRVVTVAKHGQKRKRVLWLLRFIAETPLVLSIDIIGSSPGPQDRRRSSHDSKIRAFTQKLGAKAKSVTFHDDLDETSIRALYSEADLFVLPAKREMMAISPLEAISHGVPVLISSDGGATSYVKPTGQAQVFRARSYTSFSSRLTALLLNHETRETLILSGKAALATTHSPGNFLANIEKLINGPLSRHE